MGDVHEVKIQNEGCGLNRFNDGFVYAMASILILMPPPLGVWHIEDIVSFTEAILCSPFVRAFACGVGGALFDI